MTFTFYVADRIVFTRWLCSCGSGGFALDTATFRRQMLSHLEARHGNTNANVVGNVRTCSPELIAFIERQILG